MTSRTPPVVPGDPTSLTDRFWAKVEKTATCWNWVGARVPDGYGQVSIGGRCTRAHRVAYLALVGEIREGLVLDHLCRNRACVNPDHLEPVEQAENMRRQVPGGRNGTVCRNGLHPWPESAVQRGKQLRCFPCEQAVARANYQRKKAAA